MSSPLFSIVVPVYKAEKYLEGCVDSLVNQTEKNIEIILVDDGSPDSCPAICDRYAEQYKNIFVIHKSNSGPSDARNAALKIAKGDYIMFVDSDDYIDPDACERMLPFTKKGFDIIATDGIPEGENISLVHRGVENNKVYDGEEFLKKSVMNGNIPMVVWLHLYRREFLVSNNLVFKNGVYHEDEEFIPRTFLSAQSVISTGDKYYHYVIRENSIMTNPDKRKNAEDLYNVCKCLSSVYDELTDGELRLFLKDSLVNKYLSLFQDGKLYQYGSQYLHKDFVLANAYRRKTKLKARLYNLSPRLYWYINRFL